MDDEQCDRYNSYVRNGNNLYGGIPQNFYINIAVYAGLILLFILLRKRAWNYGKLSWLYHSKKPSSTTPLDDTMDADESLQSSEIVNESGKWTLLKYVPTFIKMSDEALQKRCGKDAVLYCQFQRNLIGLVFIMMVLALTIILPLNLSGKQLSFDSSSFDALTIGNVPGKSDILWGHFLVALGILILSFIISNKFLNNVNTNKEAISRTLMIRNIPEDQCEETVIQQHFREAFPDVNVTKAQVCYKYKNVIYLNIEREAAEESLQFCYDELDRTETRMTVVPKTCGRLMCLAGQSNPDDVEATGCCLCRCCRSESSSNNDKGCKKVDGIEFYKSEVMRLSEMLLEEKRRAMTEQKLPLIFVSTASTEQALEVRRHYLFQPVSCLLDHTNKPRSSVSKKLNSDHWNVQFAPEPKDIMWENLHISGWRWFVPMILLYLVGAGLTLLLTTPPLVLSMLNKMNFTQGLTVFHNPYVSQLAPALILVLVSSLLPTVVALTVRYTRYWTITSEQIALMNQIYILIVLSVLILPSLGLNSVPQLLMWLFPENQTAPDTVPWNCIFMSDGGALFCNYIITASFIGTALELLRLGELFLLACRLCCSRSRAEDKSISRYIMWEFQYGFNYAWTLATFTVISAYAVIVPIITVFGLIYMLLKHVVDRYNMIHVNLRAVVHRTVHHNAASLMQVGLVLMQGTVTVYVILKRGKISPLSILCLLAFVFGILLSVGRPFKQWLFSLSWIKYSQLILAADMKPSSSLPGDRDGNQLLVEASAGILVVDDIQGSVFMPRQMVNNDDVDSEDISKATNSLPLKEIGESSAPSYSRDNYGAVVDEDTRPAPY